MHKIIAVTVLAGLLATSSALAQSNPRPGSVFSDRVFYNVSSKWVTFSRKRVVDGYLVFHRLAMPSIDGEIEPELALDFMKYGCARSSRLLDWAVITTPPWVFFGPPSGWKDEVRRKLQISIGDRLFESTARRYGRNFFVDMNPQRPMAQLEFLAANGVVVKVDGDHEFAFAAAKQHSLGDTIEGYLAMIAGAFAKNADLGAAATRTTSEMLSACDAYKHSGRID